MSDEERKNDTIVLGDLLKNVDTTSPALSAALERANRAGIDLSKHTASISKLQGDLEAKIRVKQTQINSARELKNGSAFENEKRAKKREKLNAELGQLQHALSALTIYQQ